MTYRSIKNALFCATVALLGATGCSTELDDGDYQVFRVAFGSEKADAGCYVDGEIPASIREDTTTLKSGGTFIMYVTEQGDVFLDTGSMVLLGEKDGSTGYEFEGEVVDVEVPPGRTILDADHDGIDDTEDLAIDADMDGLDDTATDFEGFPVDDSVDVDGDGLDDRTQDDIVDVDNDGEDDRYVELPAPYKLRTVRDYRVEITMNGDVVIGETRSTIRNTCEGAECPETFEASTCTVQNEFQGVLIEDAQVDVALGAPTGEPSAP